MIRHITLSLFIGASLMSTQCTADTSPTNQTNAATNTKQQDTVTPVQPTAPKPTQSEATLDTIIKPLSTKTDLEEALKADGPKAFKFFATWCPPCKQIKHGVASAALKHKESIKTYSIDADNKAFTEFMNKYKVTALPTILFLPSGRTVVGAESDKKYEEIFGEIVQGSKTPKDTKKEQKPAAPQEHVKNNKECVIAPA